MITYLYLAFLAVVFYWQVISVRTGKRTRGKAIVLHFACTAAPAIVYGVVFLALVGIEELTGTAIIGEGYARSLLFVITAGLAAALLLTLIFALTVIFIKPCHDKVAQS